MTAAKNSSNSNGGKQRAATEYVVLRRLPDQNGRRVWEERGTFSSTKDDQAVELADKDKEIPVGEECRAVSTRNWNPLYLEETVTTVNGVVTERTRKARNRAPLVTPAAKAPAGAGAPPSS